MFSGHPSFPPQSKLSGFSKVSIGACGTDSGPATDRLPKGIKKNGWRDNVNSTLLEPFGINHFQIRIKIY